MTHGTFSKEKPSGPSNIYFSHDLAFLWFLFQTPRISPECVKHTCYEISFIKWVPSKRSHSLLSFWKHSCSLDKLFRERSCTCNSLALLQQPSEEHESQFSFFCFWPNLTFLKTTLYADEPYSPEVLTPQINKDEQCSTTAGENNRPASLPKYDCCYHLFCFVKSLVFITAVSLVFSIAAKKGVRLPLLRITAKNIHPQVYLCNTLLSLALHVMAWQMTCL